MSLTRSKQYYKSNQDRCRAAARKWYSENKEQKKKYFQEYRKKKREQYLATQEKYRKNNQPKINLYLRCRRRKTKEKINPTLLHNWESKECGICHGHIDSDYHLDHIIPISRGGEHSEKNIQLAHPHCNMSKGNRII